MHNNSKLKDHSLDVIIIGRGRDKGSYLVFKIIRDIDILFAYQAY